MPLYCPACGREISPGSLVGGRHHACGYAVNSPSDLVHVPSSVRPKPPKPPKYVGVDLARPGSDISITVPDGLQFNTHESLLRDEALAFAKAVAAPHYDVLYTNNELLELDTFSCVLQHKRLHSLHKITLYKLGEEWHIASMETM